MASGNRRADHFSPVPHMAAQPAFDTTTLSGLTVSCCGRPRPLHQRRTDAAGDEVTPRCLPPVLTGKALVIIPEPMPSATIACRRAAYMRTRSHGVIPASCTRERVQYEPEEEFGIGGFVAGRLARLPRRSGYCRACRDFWRGGRGCRVGEKHGKHNRQSAEETRRYIGYCRKETSLRICACQIQHRAGPSACSFADEAAIS